MVISIIPGALGYAAIRERSRRWLVRVVFWIFLIAPLLCGTALRIWHDHPKGLSAVGLAAEYREHLEPGSVIYVPFSHLPFGVRAITAEMQIDHKTLPRVKQKDLGTLLRPGQDEVFIWLDSYYIWAYFEQGEYLRRIDNTEVGGVRIECVKKIDASPRNLGFFLRISRLKAGAHEGEEGGDAADPVAPLPAVREAAARTPRPLGD